MLCIQPSLYRHKNWYQSFNNILKAFLKLNPQPANVCNARNYKYDKNTFRSFKVRSSLLGNKQTCPLVKRTIGTYGRRRGSGEKYKTTRWRAASCFRAIKHFHFQFLVGAERRGAVGGQPVADDRWFVYRRSLCSSNLISPASLLLALSHPLPICLRSCRTLSHVQPPPLTLSLPVLSLSLSLFGLFVASIFFVVFHFEQPRFTPVHRQSRHSNHPRESNGYQAII